MQDCDIVRLLCHCCKHSCIANYLISCKISGCGKFFCHKCLTSRYKYSKTKVAKLPTSTWKCPVCTGKCKSDECQSGINIPIKKRGIKKIRTTKCCYRKKKTNGSRKIIIKYYSRIDANTGTPSDDRITQGVSTPKPHRILPPITSNNILLIAFLDIDDICSTMKTQEKLIYPVQFYELMSLSELLKLSSLPIS